MTQHYNMESFEGLRQILARLRAPDGCPWDREQTHPSLRKTLLEECYEALEALDKEDPNLLAEELGDILLQIAFHCQIAEEASEFTYADVFRRINEKLIRRHPHVFGDAKVSSAREVEEQWEQLKEKERAGRQSLLDGIANVLPALAQAQVISQRAASAGFEWADLQGVKDQVAEELQEMEQAPTKEEQEKEFGDVLYSLVNVGRWMGLDAESALRGANQRFGRRFRHMEQAALRQGTSFTKLTTSEMNVLWEQAKHDLEQRGAPS